MSYEKQGSTLMPYNPYTAEQLATLRSWYGKISVKRLAKKLGRSVDSVRNVAWRNNIKVERSPTSWERLEELLGITADAIKWRIRTADKDADVIPHDRSGRFYILYEDDVMSWLRRGNVLTFDRDLLHPSIQRIYDTVRRQYYTHDEIYAIDSAIVPYTRDNVKPVIRAGKHCSFYRREDIWEMWWRRGYTLPRTSHPYAEAIRQAWEATYVRKSEVMHLLYKSAMTTIAKRCEGSTFKAIRKDELRKYFDSIGRHDLAQRYTERPIHYMELIKELEGRQ